MYIRDALRKISVIIIYRMNSGKKISSAGSKNKQVWLINCTYSNKSFSIYIHVTIFYILYTSNSKCDNNQCRAITLHTMKTLSICTVLLWK